MSGNIDAIRRTCHIYQRELRSGMFSYWPTFRGCLWVVKNEDARDTCGNDEVLLFISHCGRLREVVMLALSFGDINILRTAELVS